MKRKMERRTSRWSDRPAHVEVPSPYSDGKAPARDPRSTDSASRLGPYEASYDIALGYGHDRSIVLP